MGSFTVSTNYRLLTMSSLYLEVSIRKSKIRISKCSPVAVTSFTKGCEFTWSGMSTERRVWLVLISLQPAQQIRFRHPHAHCHQKDNHSLPRYIRSSRWKNKLKFFLIICHITMRSITFDQSKYLHKNLLWLCIVREWTNSTLKDRKFTRVNEYQITFQVTAFKDQPLNYSF